jgi:hypothetical protein
MKSIKELIGGKEKMAKMVFDRWGKVTGCWEHDGSKYGHWNNEQLTHNEILGYVPVKQVKEAEEMGAIVYQYGEWKITSETKLNDKGEPKICASDKWNILKEKNWPSRKKEAFEF